MDLLPRSNTNPNTGPNGDHTSKYIIVTIYNSVQVVLIYCGLTSKVQHKPPILGPMEITPVSTLILIIYNSVQVVLIYCGLTSKVQHKPPLLDLMEITPVST